MSSRALLQLCVLRKIMRGKRDFIKQLSVFPMLLLCNTLSSPSNKVLEHRRFLTSSTFLFITADVTCYRCQEILGNIVLQFSLHSLVYEQTTEKTPVLV